jgi:hypothetical protein
MAIGFKPRRMVAGLVMAHILAVSAWAQQAPILAPGFSKLPKDSTVLMAPLDVELFEISGGGVPEPKADWTENATRFKKKALGLKAGEINTQQAEEHAELLNLSAAVARAISESRYLPTKVGKLDWSVGDALKPLQQASGARYALFTWVRDSYASGERKAMMGVVAVLSAVATAGTSVIVLGGGVQVGYATLVDLETGQVLWFNQIGNTSGDLRTEPEAVKTVEGLLKGFPVAQ